MFCRYDELIYTDRDVGLLYLINEFKTLTSQHSVQNCDNLKTIYNTSFLIICYNSQKNQYKIRLINSNFFYKTKYISFMF